MEILALTSLTEDQTSQILALQQECIAFDKSGRELFLSNDINYHKDMPCFFLSYETEILSGVLIVFAPTIETAEISAFVRPENRMRGVFSGLLLEAWGIIHSFNITKVLMVTDAEGSACKQILTKWSTSLSHSEYLLVYRGNQKQVAFPFGDLCLVREAASSDLDKMVEMNMAAFGEDRENAAHMVRENFNHPLTRNFVGTMDGEIFGLANVRKEGAGFYICGFCISPALQGKSMGRYLLYEILKMIDAKDGEEITLEVDSINQPAYHLYVSSGFEVLSQADYYWLKLPVIQSQQLPG
jgi:ribosomal protein S18 acetylase RimI-like enzyme